MGSRSNLPIDILNCILLELPVKSLLRFKITCKSWFCSIDDPDFIKSHLSKSYVDMSRQKFLFVNAGGFVGPGCPREVGQYKIRSTDASINSDSEVVCLPNIPGFGRDPYFEVLSCSGLVFVMSCRGSMALWNPAVQKYKLIPDFPPIKKKKRLTVFGSSPIFGFAYDFVAEDYKVVRVHIMKIVEHPGYNAAIYSVKKQSWRPIHNIYPVRNRWDVYSRSVSLNGVIHRMVHEQGKYLIISFHVADEKFIVTPVPSWHYMHGEKLGLHAWGGRLCVLAYVGQEMSIWSVEKDRKTACLTWNYITKFPTLHMIDRIICVKENGNILWRNSDNGQFIEYNMRKNEYVEYSLTGLTKFMFHRTLYVESLAPFKIPWD